MNEASPARRRPRVLKRIAAGTALALGAALLAYPGAAGAQTTAVDCAALGDNPMASGMSGALDAATACGVEVRVTGRSNPYATVYATPEGRVHLAATADPVHEYRNQGFLDATLTSGGTTLNQTYSLWSFHLAHTDPAAPLVDTMNGSLEWGEDIPEPSYSGTTAVYDELADGLDLVVDVDVASAGLRFTAADADAWNALATGLSVEDPASVDVLGGALAIDSSYYSGAESTTPFTVRDAVGTVTPATLAMDAEGNLAVGLPEDALESAVFPLSLSTQWAYADANLNDWGAVTSASPDLALYRGEGGLDEPYFEAAGQAGDAITGTYCDGLVDPDCAEAATAASYWKFNWPNLDLAGFLPAVSLDFSFPVADATFRVDAAEGTDCAAPELTLSDGYSTGTSWADRPAGLGTAGSGACESGTAVYDVTDSIAETWADSDLASAVSFAMADSADAARFDGGSARFDVYFDIVGFRYTGAATTICGHSLSTAPAVSDSSPTYAEFLVNTWRPESLDLGLTWTATFSDALTGETVLTTDPVDVAVGSSPAFTLGSLPDGKYEVVYDFAADPVDFEYRSTPCYLVVDTSAPDLSVTVEDVPHYVGDSVEVKVSLEDAGFPDGVSTLTVDCYYDDTCGRNWPRTITTGTALTFDVTPAEGDNLLNLSVRDRAGNGDYVQLNLRASYDRNDFDRDGYQDLVAVRESDGKLLLHLGNGDGTFDSPITLATGWNKMDVVMAGDLTSDGNPDLLARDTATGTMYTYPGKGDGTLGTRIKVGSGWNAMGLFTSGDDYSSVGPNSGSPDLLAVRKSDGKLFYYPGLGNGTFGTPTAIGSGWNTMDSLTSVGDMGLDYQNDLLARDSRTGTYYRYTDYGHLTFEDHVALPKTSDGIPITNRIYTEIAAAGDQDGDGYIDLVAVDSRTGELVLNPLTWVRSPAAAETAVATGWGAIHLPTADSNRTYDYNGNGATDVVVRRGSDGKVYFYSGNGSAGFGNIGSWGTDLKNLNLIETAGDFNGDGFADVIGRVASNGSLYLFPGNGNGGYDYAARTRIGTGWNSMSAIVSGQDFNSDGKVDIVAREKSTGYLWLYPGKGDGTLGARVKIGTGWNSLRDITSVGDLDHDGHADIITVKSSDNCMYFYGGRGNGTLKAGVQIGCGWSTMDNIAAVGDFNGDGHTDWIARRKSDGKVYLYKGDGKGDYSGTAVIATGWTWANAIA